MKLYNIKKGAILRLVHKVDLFSQILIQIKCNVHNSEMDDKIINNVNSPEK